MSDSPLEAVLKRDRVVILGGLIAIAAIAWAYMAHEARAMAHTGICQCFGLKMGGPDLSPWTASEVFALFLMWTEMMIAMMIPSATPMILTFAAVNRRRREREEPFVPATLFLLGYLIIWTLFSALATLAQWKLHSEALLSPMMASTSPYLGGTLLMAAGFFQWTPFKRSCLSHCRSPLQFLMTDWRDGKLGALVMGLKHGAYCTGCCWLLMALLFVLGVMNIWWIGALTAIVLIEKLLPDGKWLPRLAGIALVTWGILMMA